VDPAILDQLKPEEMKKMQIALTNNLIIAFIRQMNEEMEYDLAGQRSNLLFRYFIWRDMIEEMIREKAFLGINFGKPQRSRRIEIIGQAKGEWLRDGWITPHNSFLHMIYRGGIFGAFYVALFVYLFFHLLKKFISQRSLTGFLLLSIIVYWSVWSIPAVVLEFPYSAIPFWSLLGMILAYSQNNSVTDLTKCTSPH